MISIKSKITADLKEWYLKEMLLLLKQNQSTDACTPPADAPYLESLCEGINSMDGAFYEILLTGSKEKLQERYPWVKDYGTLCDTVADLQWKRKEHPEEFLPAINAYLSADRNLYLNAALEMALKEYKRVKKETFPDNKSQAEKLFASLCDVLDQANDCIRPYIDYDMMTDKTDRNKTIRHELLYRMNVRVCPYCNRNMITTLKYQDEEAKEKYQPTADLDHLLPKSVYQLFSLSLWNFIPSCKPCNQILKRDKTCRILPLSERGFDEECTFRLDLVDADGNPDVASVLGFGKKVTGYWDNQAGKECKEEISNSIRMFRLNEQYQEQENEIRDILRKRYMEGKFHAMVSEFLHEKSSTVPVLSEQEINRMLYGCSLDPEKFIDEALSKMTYDILKKN